MTVRNTKKKTTAKRIAKIARKRELKATVFKKKKGLVVSIPKVIKCKKTIELLKDKVKIAKFK